MDRLLADYLEMARLADELSTLVSRLDLGDYDYLRSALRQEVTGNARLSDAVDGFENHWSFGRDRIKNSLTNLSERLWNAAITYRDADVESAISAVVIGMSPEDEARFRSQFAPPQPPEF